MQKKKKNNNLVNIFIGIGIFFLIASLLLMLTKKKPMENYIVDIDYNTYSELIREDKYNIILLTSPTCMHCQSYKQYVNYVCNDRNIMVYNLNLEDLNYKEYIEIHDRYTITKTHFSGDVPSILTPTTIITKNNQEIDSVSGDLGYAGFIELLEKNNIIKK